MYIYIHTHRAGQIHSWYVMLCSVSQLIMDVFDIFNLYFLGVSLETRAESVSVL